MNIKSVKILNNNTKMPLLGLGVFRSGERTYQAVRDALEVGYRHIDTAMIYENEEAVGQAIKDSGIPREEIFVTTKLWNDDMRARRVQEAFEESLRKLDTDYVDLYLIHWPVKEEFVNSYKVMEKLYLKKQIKAIGVSNFQIHHLETLMKNTDIPPAVTQIETHPYLTNIEVIKYCQSKGIACEAWSPIAKGKVLTDPKLKELADKYGKTEAQIALKWNLQRGLIIIPKSVHRQRIIENSQIFDFELSQQDMDLISSLNRDLRMGSHPDTFNF